MALLACATASWAQGAPEFTNIGAAPDPFSPNGDGIRDILAISYELTEDADWVTVDIRDSADALVVNLLAGASRTKGAYQLAWDGKDTSGALSSDGKYAVHFEAGNAAGQAPARTWYVHLDVTSPRVELTELSPNPFSPDLPGSPDSLSVRLLVTSSEPADSLFLGVGPYGSSADDTLAVVPAFAGDGEYAAHWKGAGRDDGSYWASAHIEDAAGNHGEATATFSLDTTAPLVEVSDPGDGATFAELPDSLFGVAYDPSDVVLVELAYDSGDFHAVPFATVAGDTVSWGAPLRDSLPGQGVHTVEIMATDLLGHRGSGGELGGPSTLTVTRDSEAPPVPVLDPLPSTVRTASLQVMGSAPEADTVSLYLNDFHAPAKTVTAGFNSSFTATLTLQPGVNSVAVSATDAAGNTSPISEPSEVEFKREFGVFFNERFRPGDAFEISLEDPATEVTIALYAMSGRLVKTLRADRPATSFKLSWDGADNSGTIANNGVYLCRISVLLQDGSELMDKKLVALVR